MTAAQFRELTRNAPLAIRLVSGRTLYVMQPDHVWLPPGAEIAVVYHVAGVYSHVSLATIESIETNGSEVKSEGAA